MAHKKADWLRLMLALAMIGGGLAYVAARVRKQYLTSSPADEQADPLYGTEWFDDGVLHMTGITMGRIPFKLLIHPGDLDREATEQLAADCFDALAKVDEVMSAYRPESDLSKLNNAAAGEAVTLDGELYNLMKIAQEYTARTDGAFDPTARRLFQRWKEAGAAKQLPTPGELASVRQLSGWHRIRLNDSARTATKTVDGLQVDLGAIAKGYAVDKVVEVLQAGAAAGALVEVGGEVRVFGARGERPDWILAINHPFQPATGHGARCGKLRVIDRAVATSGNYQRFTRIAGKRYSHIVDPRTGKPANAAASVTVIAADCMTADIWSTALSVLGPPGLAKIEAIDGIEAMIIMGRLGNARVYKTRRFDDYLIGGAVDLKRKW